MPFLSLTPEEHRLHYPSSTTTHSHTTLKDPSARKNNNDAPNTTSSSVDMLTATSKFLELTHNSDRASTAKTQAQAKTYWPVEGVAADQAVSKEK